VDKETLKAQRRERLYKAIRHEKPDRTPATVNGNVALLKYFKPDAVIADVVRDPVGSAKIILNGLEETGKLSNLDMISGLTMVVGKSFGAYWFCNVKLPGVELGEDELWQLDEKPCMSREDYDVILSKGWDWFTNDVLFNRIGYTEEDLTGGMEVMGQIIALMEEQPYPNWDAGVSFGSPLDKLAVGRGTVGLFKDFRQIPEKMHDVLDCIMESEMAKLDAQIAGRDISGLVAMNSPAIRCTCDYVSEKIFEEFVWPTMYPAADKLIAAGAYVFFHNDSNWNDFLHFYKRFPKHTCIYDSDGQTDIYKIKEILGDSMCITGNVSPSLLSLGTPDEVYAFCRKQIEDMGDAYILSGACSLPPNAKPENLDAMNAACEG